MIPDRRAVCGATKREGDCQQAEISLKPVLQVRDEQSERVQDRRHRSKASPISPIANPR